MLLKVLCITWRQNVIVDKMENCGVLCCNIIFIIVGLCGAYLRGDFPCLWWDNPSIIQISHILLMTEAFYKLENQSTVSWDGCCKDKSFVPFLLLDELYEVLFLLRENFGCLRPYREASGCRLLRCWSFI